MVAGCLFDVAPLTLELNRGAEGEDDDVEVAVEESSDPVGLAVEEVSVTAESGGDALNENGVEMDAAVVSLAAAVEPPKENG